MIFFGNITWALIIAISKLSLFLSLSIAYHNTSSSIIFHHFNLILHYLFSFTFLDNRSRLQLGQSKNYKKEVTKVSTWDLMCSCVTCFLMPICAASNCTPKQSTQNHCIQIRVVSRQSLTGFGFIKELVVPLTAIFYRYNITIVEGGG